MLNVIMLAVGCLLVGARLRKWAVDGEFDGWLVVDILLVAYWGAKIYLQMKGGV